MAMNPDKFAKIAESLRQYRRAELTDFEDDVDGNPIDALYVDALEGDAVLKTVLLNSTTFLVGRKGTGKSTVFAKAQIELRKRDDVISVYLDVKSLHELLSANEVAVQTVPDTSISPVIFQVHKLRKGFLGAIIAELIKELKDAYESRSLIQRWVTKARGYNTVINELEKLATDVRTTKLSEEEVPILQMITVKTKGALTTKKSTGTKAKAEAKLGAKPELKASTGIDAFDESISDKRFISNMRMRFSVHSRSKKFLPVSGNFSPGWEFNVSSLFSMIFPSYRGWTKSCLSTSS